MAKVSENIIIYFILFFYIIIILFYFFALEKTRVGKKLKIELIIIIILDPRYLGS